MSPIATVAAFAVAVAASVAPAPEVAAVPAVLGFVLNHAIVIAIAMHMNYIRPGLPHSCPQSCSGLDACLDVSVSAKSMLTQIRVCRIILPTVQTYFFRYRI